MTIRQWEKRLRDLWILLEHCHATYMEPDIFRMNINQFLQTSRTVTFIIQKNKASIPDFETWYGGAIQDWATNPIMVWAKDSRNKIEKEGDLELNSTLNLCLIFSYIVEQDVKIITGRSELLKAGTKKLIRFARKNMPSHVIESSAIKIERRWVANSLPGWELLHAFNYIYRTLYMTCRDLAKHLGSVIDATVPDPTALFYVYETARQVRYLKLSDLKCHYQHIKRVPVDRMYKPPETMTATMHRIQDNVSRADSTEKIFEALSEMAERMFERDGFHVPMLFMLDRHHTIIDFMSVEFNDQVEKYIFWRNISDRFVANKAASVVWICEAWIRDANKLNSLAINKLSIIGERLYINLLDDTGISKSAGWEIIRSIDGQNMALKKLEYDDLNGKIPFFFAPILHAIGLPYPDYF